MNKIKGRLLGLDIGDRRIGVAVSDEMGWTAQPIVTISRTNVEKDTEKLKQILDEYGVKKIVVGLPRALSGKITPQTQKVLDFIEEIKKKWDIPIEAWDEWFTTKEAERILISADMSRKKRKGVIDQLSAVLILQSYLNAQK